MMSLVRPGRTSFLSSFRLCTDVRHHGAPSPRQRRISSAVLSHSSWFKVEEQGMTQFDLLARGSAFFVHGPTTSHPIALLSAHVAAPHRFPNYFPEPWLQHVQDSHCRTVIETRSSTGEVITSSVATLPLISGFRHASLDVAAFLPTHSSPQPIPGTTLLQLASENKVLSIGDKVTIAGFRLVGEAGSGTEAVLPIQLHGNISQLRSSRGFVDTGAVHTVMGMCGGPVVLTSDPTTCVGILEGLIPTIPKEDAHKYEDAHHQLQGHSVFVTARELSKFLHDVEASAEQLSSHNHSPHKT